ncbi:MAG: hypothetical protein KGK01_03145 [Bradyrhizobium sp.]|nr:hypothetical protein [Bradyrhizobium sp.]MDE2066875.1 hypothetical protein [Bradyrhizobium sp.]MDE2241458.1 hypothetical protein [Bradyrhizobium sp.]
MIGASLSRWTMSYFSVALLSLLGAEALMVAGFGFPSRPIAAPQTLILVHLVAIGWLSLLMSGALIQFVPVLVAKPLAHPDLPAAALALLLIGLASLIAGFCEMAGISLTSMPWLPFGAIILSAGFGLNLWNLGRTLWSARPVGLPARFVVAGLVSLAGVVALGIVFSLNLARWTTSEVLVALTAHGVALHAALGLGGWLGFTAIGVSYRLLAMFMLAPEEKRWTSRIALGTGTASIVVLLVGGPACVLFGLNVDYALVVALLMAGICVAFYGHDVVRLYQTRKRRNMELNTRMAAVALGGLGIAAVLLLALAALGEVVRYIGAVVFFVAFGWLSGLGLAKLYKIVAFLTWLQCYGPLIGKQATPRVQDLADEPRAMPWFWLYFASVSAASVAAFLDTPPAFRIAALGMLVATAGICVELVRIRTLKSVPTPMLPEGVQARPRLILPGLER